MISLIKGEDDILQCSADQDVSNWKIRVLISDKQTTLKKANKNVSYGSNTQISIDKTDKTIFFVHIHKNETNDFKKHAEFELELENPKNDSLTVHIDKIIFS